MISVGNESMVNYLTNENHYQLEGYSAHGLKQPRNHCPQLLRKVRLSNMTGIKPTNTKANEGKAASPKRSSRASW